MSNRKYNTTNVYVSGSNAVKLDGVYSNYKKERENTKETVKKKTAAKTNKKVVKVNKTAHSINRLYTSILVFVIMATLAVIVLMLKTQFVVSDNSQKIISLQQELLQVKATNEQLESQIVKDVNMNEVYKIATEELGMIQPTAENIVYIDEAETSYTVRYADVEVLDDSHGVSIGNVLGFISKGW